MHIYKKKIARKKKRLNERSRKNNKNSLFSFTLNLLDCKYFEKIYGLTELIINAD